MKGEIVMKKNAFFMLAMAIVSMLLAFLSKTGMTAHIVISVLGLAIMIPFTLKTKSEWTKAPLEVLMRVMYLIAIVTGGVMMNVHGVAVVGIVHKVCALLFAVLLLVLYIPKCKK